MITKSDKQKIWIKASIIILSLNIVMILSI